MLGGGGAVVAPPPPAYSGITALEKCMQTTFNYERNLLSTYLVSPRCEGQILHITHSAFVVFLGWKFWPTESSHKKSLSPTHL